MNLQINEIGVSPKIPKRVGKNKEVAPDTHKGKKDEHQRF